MKIANYPQDIVDFLREGFRSVLANPAVAMLSNSKAGATGYEHWLKLRPGTIRVVRNGYMPSAASPPQPDAVEQFRTGLGWSSNDRAVGTLKVADAERYAVVEAEAEFIDVAVQMLLADAVK